MMTAPEHPFNYDFEAREAQRQDLRQNSSPRPTQTLPESSRYAPPRRPPIDEAVNNAFSSTETSSYLSEEMIAQITQNVIKQLQNNSLDGGTPLPPTQNVFPPPPPQVQQPIPQSPSTTASGASPNMPNRVFTPPSPQKHSDYPDHISPPPQSNRQSDPPLSPYKGQKAAHFSPNRSSSPLSQSSDTSDKAQTRPKGPSRLHTGKEETTLERYWGQLFDEEGRPTARLGQFLRGLAVHIIEDYEPRHSLVITPNKMIKYYEDVKLDNELYPWSVVFDDEHSSISRMYRDLKCQHHLVQEKFNERPDIPALTPLGFERWVTLLIEAHPEAEFERLQKAVLEMPINNPDDKKERFPKEISRRLFPTHGDLKTRYLVEDSMVQHASIEVPCRPSHDELKAQHDASAHKSSMAEPNVTQSHRPSVSFAEPEATIKTVSDHVPPNIERERAPYSNMPDSAVIDDTNSQEISTPKPIERERKPYVAQVGGGRQYEAEEVRPRENSKPRADSVNPPVQPKPVRSDSSANRARPININPQNNQQLPKPEIHQHYRTPSNSMSTRQRRRRSPSFSRGTPSDFRRSESDIRGYVPSFEPGSIPRSHEYPFDEMDTKRYFDNQARERARRKAEDDSRMYGESPRRGIDDRGPKRGDYPNDEEYWKAGGRRDRGYDDSYKESYSGPAYR